jgi:hypothetical protein
MTVSNAFRFAIGLVCTACFILACAGGVVGYSPVPFWDMWDGTVLFLHNFLAGDWTALFSQHNEHRIVLTRLLFLVEYAVLDGSGRYLIAANYVFALLAAATFWRALAWLHAPAMTRAAIGIGAALLVFALLTLWLRRGAPTAPDRAGLVAGVAAGAFGSFAVSLHCPDNDIVHIGLWHSAAVVAMAGLGRVLIPRLVRW